jgi:hypothetical protein
VFFWQSDKNFYKEAGYAFYKKCLPHEAHLSALARSARASGNCPVPSFSCPRSHPQPSNKHRTRAEWLAHFKVANAHPRVPSEEFVKLERMFDGFFLPKFFRPCANEGEGEAETEQEERRYVLKLCSSKVR